MIAFAGGINQVQARSQPFTPEPGDTSLKSKCRAEAQMMGVGGKGTAVHAESNRMLRREHFRKCMGLQ